MKKELNWAVLGCGVIANEMAQALEHMGKHLYAVGNRTHEKAVTFAEKYGVQKVYDDFQEMFHDPDVDVIYITTPHNTHIEFAREALSGGKHVLCEKSVMLNSRCTCRDLMHLSGLCFHNDGAVGARIFHDLYISFLTADHSALRLFGM